MILFLIYRAFLSSRAQDVNSIVRQIDRVLPVCNLRGEVLFDSWQDIFDGRGAPFSHQPRIFSFNGKFLPYPKYQGALSKLDKALNYMWNIRFTSLKVQQLK